MTAQILAYSNSCVNPILYAFLSEPFRRGFYAVITCIRPSGPHGVQQARFCMRGSEQAKKSFGFLFSRKLQDVCGSKKLVHQRAAEKKFVPTRSRR